MEIEKAIQGSGSPVSTMNEDSDGIVKMDTDDSLNQAPQMDIPNGGATTSTLNDTEDSKMEEVDEDEFGFYRSEATFSYTVENVNKLN